MIEIHNAQDLYGQPVALNIESTQSVKIDASGLTIFPGLIDPHVHFRTPGLEHKENWRSAAKAAIRGGYTTVFDMPNTLPPTITRTYLREKKMLIQQQLDDVGIALHYQLFFGADKNHLSEIAHVADQIVGIKVFMGCSTGNLVIDDDESLAAVFALAAKHNLLVAVHAEDEHRIKARQQQFSQTKNYADHSIIRDIETAALAVAKAIQFATEYQVRLYILHVSSEAELTLIRAAKAAGLKVFAETTPHHLFLDTRLYDQLQGKAVVNPPLRHQNQHAVLWQAIADGTIDTIGSDHAPHTLVEKQAEYGMCPSGMPGIETTLPLLISAYHAGKLSLEKILNLTHIRAREIFNLPAYQDYVLVDMNTVREVQPQDLKTKCGWSAFAGQRLQGWPVYTILNHTCYDLMRL